MKGLRFRKSFQLLPGVRLNLSKSGTSLSVGPRGAQVTSGPRGTVLSLELPGSGISYRKKVDTEGEQAPKESKSQNGEAQQAQAAPPQLDLAFWQRLTVPDDEQALVDAFKALS